MFIPVDFRPLALINTYNDLDIAPQIVEKLLNDRIEILIIDNWSTDGTFEYFVTLQKEGLQGLSVERFPSAGPSQFFALKKLLVRKEEIAVQHPGRWIIHQDSDEVRVSPWSDVSLREGLFIAERQGYNTVEFQLYTFVATDNLFVPGQDPEKHFKYYTSEWADLPQVKAWRQPEGPIDLASSGGHSVEFAERKIFPRRFILKHFSLRNTEQARRKIFSERLGRFSPEERKIGFHVQYDKFQPPDTFIQEPSQCSQFDESLLPKYSIEGSDV